MTFQEAIDRWYRLSSTRWCQETRRVTGIICEVWISLLGDKEIETVSPFDIQTIYLHLVEKKYSPYWVNTHRGKLHAFFAWALESDITPKNLVTRTNWPTLRASVEYDEIPLTAEKEEAMVNAIPGRWRKPVEAYVRLVLVTALRRSTMYSLRAGYVTSDGWLDVPSGIVKNSEHLKFPLFLFKAALAALEPLGPADGLLIRGLPSKQHLGVLLREIAGSAGLDPETFTTTALRRVALDRFLQRCPDLEEAKRFFGWKTTEVMDRHYRFKLGDQRRIALAQNLLLDQNTKKDFGPGSTFQGPQPAIPVGNGPVVSSTMDTAGST